MTPEELKRPLSRDPCTLKGGLFGKRGELSLYGDRLVFATGGKGRDEKELQLDSIDWLELQGRNRQQLGIGFEGGAVIFKLSQAPARFQDLCALLVQLHPTPPWIDPRFGRVDSEAVSTFLDPFGLKLEPKEQLRLCEWSLAWKGEDRVRCGWLALTSHRILFLPSSNARAQSKPRVYQPKLVERIDSSDITAGQLWFVASDEFLRFDPYGGESFVREFWRFCDAPVRGGRDSQVRRGQPLRRLEGETPLVRVTRGKGGDLLFERLYFDLAAGQGSLRTNVSLSELRDLQEDEEVVFEMVKRAGLFRFEGRVVKAEAVIDGPFKPSHAVLEIAPTSDIRFVNRRRAFRVSVNIPAHVQVHGEGPEGEPTQPLSTLCRLVDLSNIGCALVGPASIPDGATLEFELPLGTEGEQLHVLAECVHVRPMPGTALSRQYGLHLVGLSQRQRDAIQQEVVRQERLQLRRRAMVRGTDPPAR